MLTVEQMKDDKLRQLRDDLKEAAAEIERLREGERLALLALDAIIWQRDYAAEEAGISQQELTRAWNTRLGASAEKSSQEPR